MRAAASLAAPALALAPTPAAAQADPYRQHMDNGVKLFQDQNYEAALVEFDAAYNVNPRASPLLNIALCHKALFRYPKAIAALERALERHRDTMDQADIASAQRAIEEMRALLARITVEVTPPHATLLVDGEEQPPAAGGSWVIDLGPGLHRIGARAEGHAIAEESVTLVSGERDRLLALTLTPDKGYVTVDAGDPRTAVAIDQQFMAYGRWEGFLPPGTHLVQIYRPGNVIYGAHILVVAGKMQAVRPGHGGVPVTGGAAATPARYLPPPPPPPPRPPQRTPPRRGLFVLGAGSLLWPLGRPRGFPEIQANSGGAGAIRVGYRVNDAASFDLMLQYMNVGVSAAESAGGSDDAKYTFEARRMGLNLRLMTPGQVLRFTGSVGGGLSYDSVRFSDEGMALCPARPDDCFDADGVNPFLFVDAGVELDFSGALVGFALEGYFQSARGIDHPSDDDLDLYEPRALIHLGGSLRAGYAFW
jgi:hypothetical protein